MLWLAFILLVCYLVAPLILPTKKRPLRLVETGQSKIGESAPLRQVGFNARLASQYNGARTIPELFRASALKFRHQRCLGERKVVRVGTENKTTIDRDGKKVTKTFNMPYLTDYQWQSFAEVKEQVAQIGCGLRQLGLDNMRLADLQNGQKVGLFASTRPEWMLSAQACFEHCLPIVTVYATLGEEALRFSFEQTKLAAVITEAALLETVVASSVECRQLKLIVYFDHVDEAKRKAYGERLPTVKIVSFQELLAEGAAKTPPLRSPTPDDLAVIMYTSGSTDKPKGVMMTHANIISCVSSASQVVPDLGANDTFLAYLPLAHVMELVCETAMLACGAPIGYANIQRLRDDQAFSASGQPRGDLSALRPTLMPAVPLVLDRLKNAVTEKIRGSHPFVRELFRIAYFMRKQELSFGRGKRWSLWNLVFQKAQAQLGGRIRFVLSGGAPLSAETQEFTRIVFGTAVCQGYGLTESCGGGNMQTCNDDGVGTVGIPIACSEMKLVDVPEMGYRASDRDAQGRPTPRGEVCLSGTNISDGYYELPEKTASDFRTDNQGKRWFYTGDIGALDSFGRLSIVDRKKDLVKLAHGEYIALGKIEAVLRGSPFLDSILVYGDAKCTNPVALVVPNRDKLIKTAAADGISTDDFAVLCGNRSIIEKVFASLRSEAARAKLKPIEQLAAIALVADPWTPQNGYLTDALKLKRQVIVRDFQSKLDALCLS